MDVTASDLDCLHILNQGGPTTAAELAHKVDLTPGAVSRMIDRLDAAGCIRRTDDPNDRRRVLIGTTPEGLTSIAAYYSGLTNRAYDDLLRFLPEELEIILRFIERSQRSATAELARLRNEEFAEKPRLHANKAQRRKPEVATRLKPQARQL
jgi:DNA-binding MarR family transcriptional regulator